MNPSVGDAQGAAAHPNVKLALALTGTKTEVPGVKTFCGRIDAAMIKEVIFLHNTATVSNDCLQIRPALSDT